MTDIHNTQGAAELVALLDGYARDGTLGHQHYYDRIVAWADRRAPAAQQAGWVSVPVEPTDEMVAAAIACGKHSTKAEYYAAMIAARPSAPADAAFSPDWANYRQGVKDGAEEAASVREELLGLLIESQESIGGDWRGRRDVAVARALQAKPEAAARTNLSTRNYVGRGIRLAEAIAAEQIAKPEAAKGGGNG